MINKEYIVFTAFVLVNAMLAMNCFTMSLWYKVEKQNKNVNTDKYSSLEVDVRRKWQDNLESLNTLTPTKSPSIYMRWISNDGYSKHRLVELISKSIANALCILIYPDQNKYKNPESNACAFWKDSLNTIYPISSELSEKIIEPQINNIDEIIINTKYADNIIFLLKDKNYLAINFTKAYNEEGAWEKIKNIESLENFLDNSKQTLFRKKINTMVRISYKSYSKSYISFLYEKQHKYKVIILDWDNIYDPNRDPSLIYLSLLYPVTLLMDIFLMPIGAILFWTGVLPFNINLK
jgi:hypothetical protein